MGPCLCCGFEITGPSILEHGGSLHPRCAEWTAERVRATADERETWTRFAGHALHAATSASWPPHTTSEEIMAVAASSADDMLDHWKKRWGGGDDA